MSCLLNLSVQKIHWWKVDTYFYEWSTYTNIFGDEAWFYMYLLILFHVYLTNISSHKTRKTNFVQMICLKWIGNPLSFQRNKYRVFLKWYLHIIRFELRNLNHGRMNNENVLASAPSESQICWSQNLNYKQQDRSRIVIVQ